ncbi:MAG TPA: tetratricopeptide repeat protein [Anaeromyxobacteraceae bacterium]|nr:tetratricopeptide repeat protein [Anaeromyxobacteraceae bacterium]
MDRNTVLGFAVGVVVALLVGYIVVSKINEPSSAPIAPTTGLQGAPQPPAAAMEQQIAASQALVAQDPKNRQGWVELGNAYFDTHQRQKSIDAYAKALALQGDDPNVLTDQGVMYRELGAFDKAAANFEKANKIDPRHMQSLFNLGIVYADDLKQPEKAKKAWNKILETEPASPIALQARQALQRLDAAGAPRGPVAPFPPPAAPGTK